MNADDEYSVWLSLVALAVILAPTCALLVGRRRIGALNTASGLVIWGALAATGEHGSWAMRLAWHERYWLNPHSAGHYFMSGIYAAVAGVLLSVIAVTLLRDGRRNAWFAVLFVLLIGGSAELVMNGPTGLLYHHIGLYGYVLAWLAALVIAYKPTFSGTRPYHGDPLASLDEAITPAPRAIAICTATAPTPPAPPSTNRVSPALTSSSRRPRSPVSPATPAAAATAQSTDDGLTAQESSTAYSAWVF
jgi:lysylphosphatidylglycerol synthetase-like protein (DUF2156 family)